MRLQWISFSRCRKFVHLGTCTFNIINNQLSINFVNIFGYDGFRTAFFYIIVMHVEYLTYDSWLLDEAWSCALNIGNIKAIYFVLKVCSTFIWHCLQVHGRVIFVIALECHNFIQLIIVLIIIIIL